MTKEGQMVEGTVRPSLTLDCSFFALCADETGARQDQANHPKPRSSAERRQHDTGQRRESQHLPLETQRGFQRRQRGEYPPGLQGMSQS